MLGTGKFGVIRAPCLFVDAKDIWVVDLAHKQESVRAPCANRRGACTRCIVVLNVPADFGGADPDEWQRADIQG